MDIWETNGCCSLIEICGFDNLTSKYSLIQDLKNYYKVYLYDNSNDYPRAMFATTRDADQPEAVLALKALKFRATKFKSRHDKGTEKSLTRWWRSTPPPEINKYIKTLLKERNSDDIW